MTNKYLLSILSVAVLFLAGCSQKSPTLDKPVLNVKIISSDTKTPLAVHFFTLKSDEVFKKLDYFELVDDKRVNWNNELIGQAKTLLAPGSTEIFQVALSPDIQYYALVIGFKDVEDNDNWRYIRAVNPHENQNIAFKLSQVNGYTSRALHRVKKYPTQRRRANSKIIQIENRISNQVDSQANRAVDRKVDNMLGRIFQ